MAGIETELKRGQEDGGNIRQGTQSLVGIA